MALGSTYAPRGPKDHIYKHKNTVFWFLGPGQGGFQKPCTNVGTSYRFGAVGKATAY